MLNKSYQELLEEISFPKVDFSPYAGKLEGKVALVTGASQGIGEACAKAMLEAGARVIAVARSEQKLNDVFSAYGDQVITLEADLLKKADRATLIKKGLKDAGQIDILLANAGLYVGGDVVKNDADHIEDVITLNVTAVMRSVRDVLPHMYKRKTGDVVVIGSIAGDGFNPYYEAIYSPAKSAAEKFAKLLRPQAARKGVRVGVVSPGPTFTPLVMGWDPKRLAKSIKKKEFASVEQIADSYMFMVTRPADEAVYHIGASPKMFLKL